MVNPKKKIVVNIVDDTKDPKLLLDIFKTVVTLIGVPVDFYYVYATNSIIGILFADNQQIKKLDNNTTYASNRAKIRFTCLIKEIETNHYCITKSGGDRD